jgi:hypothetical protein
MVIVRRAVAAAAEATVDAMARGAREVTRGRTPRESVAARRFEEGSGSASEHKTNARRALRSDVHQTGKTRRVVSAGCRAVVLLPPAVFRRGRRASARPTHLSLAHAESEPKMSTSAELAAASARSGDAAPMDGERAPLLRAGASPSSRGDARRDRRGSQTHAPSRGVLAALGALAACGIIAVVYGASRAPPRARLSARGVARRALDARLGPRDAGPRHAGCYSPPSRDPHVPHARDIPRGRDARTRALPPLSPRAFAHALTKPRPLLPPPSLAQAAASPRPPRRSATRPRPRSRDARSAAWARRARGSSGKISPRVSSVPPRSRPRRSRRASPGSRSPTTASSSSCAGAPLARGPPRSARSRRTSWSSS